MGGIRITSRSKEVSRARPVATWVAAFLALLFQNFLPVITPLARLFDFPLLVIVYFSTLRQSKIFGIWFGTFLGLIQDALAHGYLGLMGIAKAIVGYLAASVGIKFDLEGLLARGFLTGVLVVIHDLCLFVVRRAMLESPEPFHPLARASRVLANMAAALVIFQMLDYFKKER